MRFAIVVMTSARVASALDRTGVPALLAPRPEENPPLAAAMFAHGAGKEEERMLGSEL